MVPNIHPGNKNDDTRSATTSIYIVDSHDVKDD
jgi:hypothetical protein